MHTLVVKARVCHAAQRSADELALALRPLALQTRRLRNALAAARSDAALATASGTKQPTSSDCGALWRRCPAVRSAYAAAGVPRRECRRVWRDEIAPCWPAQRGFRRTRALWKQGLPVSAAQSRCCALWRWRR